MYLAPLNYDRFFKKVFSDTKIAQRFLEDFLDTRIESLEILKEKHHVTDDAAFVEFDFRCKIDGAYIIIDMQQWYKPDIAQRFYLYHALNSGLQLENLPKKKIAIDKTTRKVKKVKDYRLLAPVYTIVWMVDDTLKFKDDFVCFRMAPEIVINFVQNEKLWNHKEIREIMEARRQALEQLSNKTKEFDFFGKNQLIFVFQKNIVRNIEENKTQKYIRWFEFAEKTLREENTAEDFKSFTGDEAFDEIMRRLDKRELSREDIEYIENEKESIEEVRRYDEERYEEGIKAGIEKGIEKGIKEGVMEEKIAIAKISIQEGLPMELIEKLTSLSKQEIENLSLKKEFANERNHT